MKRILLSVLGLAFVMPAICQSFGPGGVAVVPPAQMMEILPSAPDASNLIMQNSGSVSMFTGKANATIPIYEIKAGGLSVPVSLNYSTGGFRVDEMPGREGLGWTLGCEGVITRSVHGKPDDGNNIIRKNGPVSSNPPNPPSYDDRFFFFQNVTGPNGLYDAEADEFNVSAPGLESFKFLINDAGEIVQFPYTNNKIEIIRSPVNTGPFNKFIITSTNGTKYEFGGTGAFEKTLSHNFSAKLKNFAQIRTSFFITRITLADGNFVQFNYTSFLSYVYNGISETVSKGDGGYYNGCDQGIHPCPTAVPQTSSYSQTISMVNYSTAGLSSIQSSNGQSVNFTYGFAPNNEDGNTADCLIAVKVSAGDYTRNWHFLYTTPQANNGTPGAAGLLNPRFFLSTVGYTDPGSNTDINYEIEYKDISNLPMRLSFSQDHLGFYNGIENNTTLLPNLPGDYWTPYGNADRSFHSGAAVTGTLQKITYPTGGFEKINYEPNTVTKEEEIHDWVTAGAGGVAPGSPGSTAFVSAVFHVYKAQNVTVSLTSNDNPDPNHIVGLINGSLIDLSTGNSYGDDIFITIPGSAASKTYALVPGDYKLITNIKANHGGDISMLYDAAAPGTHWINYESGGIRVSSIERYDPLTEKSNYKFYKYAPKDHLDRSSGITDFVPQYTENAMQLKHCSSTEPQADPFAYCGLTMLSSNSQVPVYSFPNFMRYQYVIESDAPDFVNGSILHEFNTEHLVAYNTVNNFPIRDVPPGEIINSFGKEVNTTWYNNSFIPVKKLAYEYDNAPLYSKEYIGHAIRYSFKFPDGGIPGGGGMQLIPFDQTDYTYSSFWNRLNSTTTTEYANGVEMTNIETYTYNELPATAPVNVELVKSETHDSKGQLFSTELKYPTDYTDAVSLIMIAKNMISNVINTKQKRAGNEIASSTTVYKDWFHDSKMIKPEIAKYSMNGDPEQNRIRYYGYDAKGNPLRMSKENDVNLAYIWGYNSNFPVAQVNTDKTVKYSSFEETAETTPWVGIDPSYIIRAADIAMTGENYYEKSDFELFASSLSGDYTLTYWSDQATAYDVSETVTGWPKLLRTVTHGEKTWRLYEHRISGESKVYLTGSGALDEVRLYPTGAVMKTFTYSPYVGISSQCDENNNIAYFEYDGLARLHLVRDIDRNIVKKICYNYAGQPESCGLQHFFNAEQQGSFMPTTCPPNTTANPVLYTIPANTYSSLIDQQDADEQAINALNAEGKAYANANPSCTPIPTTVCVPADCPSGHCKNGVCDNGILHLTGFLKHKRMVDGQWHWEYTCYWSRCYGDGTVVDEGETTNLDTPCGTINNTCP